MRPALTLIAAAVFFGLGAADFARAQAPVVTITISTTGGTPISPLLYGVNYVWDKIPAQDFSAYQSAMDNIAHATLSRYLGGWGAESYEWAENMETGKHAAAMPGAAPAEFLASVPAASFTTPSEAAVKNPSYITQTAKFDAYLVSRYGAHVKYWEIGNEWWLQNGARKSAARRAQALANYAALVAQAAPAMKAADPDIKIFAMADWAAPEEIAQMRADAGAGWDAVDGISVHTYCGTTDPARRCDQLPAGMDAVRRASGKDLIYASEWAAVRSMNPGDSGIENADLTVRALGDMAAAGIGLAAYWPPVGMVPQLNFCSPDFGTAYATGIAFGWMSRYYEGTALDTGGDALAARDGDDVTLIVPSGESGPENFRVRLYGTGLQGVVSAEVLFTGGASGGNGDAAWRGETAVLPVTTAQQDGGTYALFTLDPGGLDRGAAYEIARVTLRP